MEDNTLQLEETEKEEKIFVVFPSFGYWAIDGVPVSSEKANYGLHPRAVWMPTEIALHPERYY